MVVLVGVGLEVVGVAGWGLVEAGWGLVVAEDLEMGVVVGMEMAEEEAVEMVVVGSDLAEGWVVEVRVG